MIGGSPCFVIPLNYQKIYRISIISRMVFLRVFLYNLLYLTNNTKYIEPGFQKDLKLKKKT